MPTAADPHCKITFSDGSCIPYEKLEVQGAIDVTSDPQWSHATAALAKPFEYLEMRLTDHPSMDEPYRLKAVYDVFRFVRAFDPFYVQTGHVTPSVVDEILALPGITPYIGDCRQATKQNYQNILLVWPRQPLSSPTKASNITHRSF